MWINKIGNYRFQQLTNCQFDQIYASFISITMISDHVRCQCSTDGIGISGLVSAHVNTYLCTRTHACKFIRLYAFTLRNNSLEFVPFPIYPPPPSTPFPLSISLSFLPLLPSRRFSCKWYGLCLIHYYYSFFSPSPPVFLSLYTDFSFLSYSPTSAIIPTLPQFSSSSSRLISSVIFL